MRILLASSKFSPEYSGSGFRAKNLYIRLKKKYKLKYGIYTNTKIYHHDDSKKNFYRVGRLFINLKKNKIIEFLNIINDIFKTWIFIRKNYKKYDLLHTFGNSYGLSFLTIYFGYKKKPIIREICNIITTPYYPIQFSGTINKIFLRKNTSLISISPWLTKICKKYNYNNLWYRPNPINEKKYFLNFDKKHFYRKKLTSFNQHDKIIVFISSFMPQKNHRFLVKVLKCLPKKYKLILGGPNQSSSEKVEFQKVLQEIRKSNLKDRIIIINGFVKNFNEYLWASDIMAFPVSKDEGFGTPVVESQACGIPVVSNNIKDLTSHYIKEGFGGYSSSLNIKKFAGMIKKTSLIDRKKLSLNSKYLIKNISTKKIDNEYHRIIKKLINEKHSSSY